jgi:hypothetical protein
MADCFPIYGFHRTYYIVIAAIIGTCSWSSLSICQLSTTLSVLAMLLGNHATASPDVMIDAAVAEKSKAHPEAATDLQSLCTGSMSLCGTLSTLTSGLLVHTLGATHSFAFMTITSLIMLFPSIGGWLGESRVQYTFPSVSMSDKTASPTSDSNIHGISGFSGDTRTQMLKYPPELICWEGLGGSSCFLSTEMLGDQRVLVNIATLVTTAAICLGCLVLFTTGHYIIVTVSIALVIIGVSIALYECLFPSLPTLTKVALFIFLRASVQIDTEHSFFYWYTEADEGPKFSPRFVGLMSTVAFSTMFVGVVVYNSFLSKFTYRSIFTYAQLLCVFTSLLDIILVKRWNLLIGIPDKLFILGDSAVSPLVRRFISMPTCVLAAKLCPDGGGTG